jgi:hypothetical protein
VKESFGCADGFAQRGKFLLRLAAALLNET